MENYKSVSCPKMSKADPEFPRMRISISCQGMAVKIFSTGQIVKADLKKSEKHLDLAPATRNKALTRRQGYIEKCTHITEACGWPEDAKDMTLRNATPLGLKNAIVYQKEKKNVF